MKKNKEQFHQITINEYLENETLQDLEQKRVAVTHDMNFLEDDLQREIYLNKIKELEKENQILIDRLKLKY